MLHLAIGRTKDFLVSMRFSILSIFVTLFVLTTCIIIVAQSIVFSHELEFTSFRLMHYTVQVLLQKLTADIRPIDVQGKLSADLIKRGVLNGNVHDMVPYTYSIVK